MKSGLGEMRMEDGGVKLCVYGMCGKYGSVYHTSGRIHLDSEQLQVQVQVQGARVDLD